MRPAVVVEPDDFLQYLLCLFLVFRSLHPVQPLLLDDAVDPLGDGIVCRLVVLGHADRGMDGLQPGDVVVTAILRASVGMMDQVGKGQSTHSPDGHVKGSDGMDSHQGIRKRPAYYLMGEGIGKQMQVYHTIVRLYVGDVCYPQLVEPYRFEALYQVLVLTVVVVGVRCVPFSLGLEHEMVLMHEPVEGIPTGYLQGKGVLQDEKQLVGTDTGRMATDLTHFIHDIGLSQFQPHTPLTTDRIITLTCLAKQSAQRPEADLWMSELEGVYCLAPAFFSRSKLYFSLPIFISSFKASLRSSE